MDAYTSLYTAGSIPALVSTMITIIYFAVKFLCTTFLMPVPERPKARKGCCIIVHPHTTRAQRVEQKAIAKFTKTYQDIVAKQVNNGRGQQPRSTGTLLLPNGRQNIRFSPDRVAAGDQTMPPLQADVERCSRRRGSDTGEHFGTGPQSSHINSATVFTERRRGEDASHAQPQPAEGNGRESQTS